MAAPVEHHWNGQWGWSRLDIYLEHEGGHWRVRALENYGRPGYQNLVYEPLTEKQARAYVARLLQTAQPPATGTWLWRDVAGQTDD